MTTSSYSNIDPVYSVEKVFRARFIERVNRFVGKVCLDSGLEYAHITNTGRLEELLTRDRDVLLKRINGGKLRYRVIGVSEYGGYALIDTITQMKVFEALIDQGLIPVFKGCSVSRYSPRVGRSQLDYIIDCGGRGVFIEVKSAVLRLGKAASYPDCPSIRGRRHIRELMKLASSGYEAHIVFIAGLPNVECFKPYRDGDPEIDRLLREALSSGVGVNALSVYMDSEGNIYLDNPDLPLCGEWLE